MQLNGGRTCSRISRPQRKQNKGEQDAEPEALLVSLRVSALRQRKSSSRRSEKPFSDNNKPNWQVKLRTAFQAPNAFKCEIIFHPVLVENHMAPGPKEPAKVMQCLWDSRSRPSGPWCFSFRLWSGAVDEHDEHFYIFPFVPRIYDLDMLICADLYDALSCDLCKLI